MEKLGEVIRDAPRRCRSCGRPDPCMPEIVGLTSDGFYECLGADPPCPACGASDPVVAVDPRTGEPVRPIKVIVMDVQFDLWMAEFKDLDHPAPFRRWIEFELQAGRE